MKHRHHMIPCAVIALIATVAIALSGSAPLGAGIGLTLLLCPLLMGTVMWLLMCQPKASAVQDDHTHAEPLDYRQHASRSPQP